MRRHYCLAVVLIYACGAVSCSTPGPGRDRLQLTAFINDERPEYLIVDITNRGRKQTTVLTKGYATASISLGYNGRKAPNFHVIFEIWEISWPDAQGRRQSRTRIPSLSDIGPVTLRQGETAQMTLNLDEDHQKYLADIDANVHLTYEIRERIAKRFGLWEGTIKLKTTVAELRQKTANK